MGVCVDLSGWASSWYALSAIGIVVSGFVIGIAYMIGVWLGNPGLTARAKNEIYQTLATLFILACAVGFAAFACNADLSGLGVSGTVYGAAESYISWIASKSMHALERMIYLAKVWGIFGSIGMGISISGMGISFSPFSGFFGLVNILNLLMSTLLILSFTVAAQYVVLKFAIEGFIGYLLPAGLVCRCFPFTRDFGGALIALSVGFALFYPFLFAMDWMVVGQPSSSTIPGSDFSEGPLIESLVIFTTTVVAESVITGGILSVLGIQLTYPIIDLYSLLRLIVEIAITFLDWMVQAAFIPTSELLIGGLFLPALNGIILVAVVRDLSRALGEEVDITTLTRMV